MGNESLGIDTSTTVDVKEKQSSYFKVIIDLFLSPTKAFQSLKSKPRWAIPFILCLVCTFLMLAAKDNPTWEKYKMIPEFITVQQFLLASIIVLLSHAVDVFGSALFIWLGLQLYPAKTNYIKILSVVSFSFLILIPETIMKLPMIFAKGTSKVYLSPVLLLPSEWNDSPLFYLMENLDIFTIWIVILIAIGIPLATEITKKQSMITVGYLFGVWLMISMFVGNLIQIT